MASPKTHHLDTLEHFIDKILHLHAHLRDVHSMNSSERKQWLQRTKNELKDKGFQSPQEENVTTTREPKQTNVFSNSSYDQANQKEPT